MIAIFAGSFAPPTLGHLDIIRRAAQIFDEVIVAVMFNNEKQYAFSAEERREMLEKITDGMKNVRVIADTGLLVDVARREGADVLLRGLRGPDDLTFEMQAAEANRQIGGIETMYIGCLPEHSWISSTIVRECAVHGAPIGAMVPEEIIGQIYAAFGASPRAERKDTE